MMGLLSQADIENEEREFARTAILQTKLRSIFEERYSEFIKKKESEFDYDTPLADEKYREEWEDHCERELWYFKSVQFKERMFQKWLDSQVLPFAEKGKSILQHARKGGDVNTNVIREKHGGKLLVERKPELEKRLQAYIDKGCSKCRACHFLAKEVDVFWSAEYLRKNLSVMPNKKRKS